MKGLGFGILDVYKILHLIHTSASRGSGRDDEPNIPSTRRCNLRFRRTSLRMRTILINFWLRFGEPRTPLSVGCIEIRRERQIIQDIHRRRATLPSFHHAARVLADCKNIVNDPLVARLKTSLADHRLRGRRATIVVNDPLSLTRATAT